MSFLGEGIARRLGIWALLQALPGEEALRGYLRMAYLGITGVIVGGVLTGGALCVGFVAAYRLLLERGLSEGQALLATGGFGLVLILGCYALAMRWFMQLVSIKQKTELFPDVGRDVLNGVWNTLTEGFLDGMTQAKAKETKARQASWRAGHKKKKSATKE